MRTRVFVALALAVAIGLATAASPYASAQPDGLNRVAAANGFDSRGREHAASPLRGYAVPGIRDDRVATGAAGFAGTLVVFALGYGTARVLRRRSALA
jgi:hypothetical protein